MPRRGFLRTPEGAWYSGYAGLKPRYYNVHYAYANPPIDVYGLTRDDAYDKEAALYLAERDRPREKDTVMFFDGNGANSYRTSQPYPEGRRMSWDKGRRSRDDAAYENAVRQYDAPKYRNGMDLPLYDPKSFQARNDPDFQPYENWPLPPPPPPAHSPVEFKYYNPPPNRNGPPADFKGYDGGPPPLRSPVDLKYYDPPPPNGPKPAELKMYDSPRNNGPSDFPLYDSSPRNGFGEGRRYEISKYPAPEREWEHAGRVSPRRDVYYEPSFHNPRSSPRNIPPYERSDRGQPRSPQPHGYAAADGQGQGRWEGPGQGQIVLDPLRGQGLTPVLANSKEAGSAYLFIRFHKDSLGIIKKACQSALVRDLKGYFVGIAETVYDFDDSPDIKTSSGCAVFQFPSLQQAEVFYNRDRHFRLNSFPQPYWDTEIFALNLLTDPGSTKAFKTFVLSEVTLNDGLGVESLREYRRAFAEPFGELLRENGAIPYASFCDRDNRRVLKRRCFDRKDMVVLHLFHDQKHYQGIWNLKRYEELREKHNGLAREKSSVFTVRNELFP